MAKARRPARQQLPSGPIPASALRSKGDDFSVEPRVDGVSGRSDGKPRRRTVGSEPIGLATLQLLDQFVSSPATWQFVDSLLADEVTPRSGRRPESGLADMILVEYATTLLVSNRATVTALNDPHTWQRLFAGPVSAFPDTPRWRLSARPPSRDQYYRLRNRYFSDPEAVAAFQQLINDLADEVARLIGIGDASGSLTHPASNNIVYGDGTHLEALFNHNSPYIDANGEIHVRRIDPDAKPYHVEGKAAGRMLVSAMARNPNANERVILRMGFKPSGVSDATVFTDMALDVFEKLRGVQGIAYDMAMRPENIDRIQDTGRHALVKAQRTSSGLFAEANLGEHIARFADGRPAHKVVVVAIDTGPHIKVILDGEPHWIPLERIQTKSRPNTETITLYGHWRIPDIPEVPITLRRGQIRVRQNSTDEERAIKRRRTRALRTIPETDPDFVRLYGLREDAESMHHHLKSQLVNRRCRCVGDTRNLLYLLMYQLRTLFTAVIAWQRRTGGDASHILGTWHPPPGRAAA